MDEGTESAQRAGRAFAAYRRRRRGKPVRRAEEDEWPELRREILAGGGIGPSPDWDNSSWPGDLYRAGGKPPDLVAAETFIGRADRPPWQQGDSEGDDSAMHRYLVRAHYHHEQLVAGRGAHEEREEEDEDRPEGPRRSHEGRRSLEERERRAHEQRMSEFVTRVRAARAAEPRQPAIGFYTDRHDVVHPVTAAREAGRRYASRRGR